jgi:hypothetical protein
MQVEHSQLFMDDQLKMLRVRKVEAVCNMSVLILYPFLS